MQVKMRIEQKEDDENRYAFRADLIFSRFIVSNQRQPSSVKMIH